MEWILSLNNKQDDSFSVFQEFLKMLEKPENIYFNNVRNSKYGYTAACHAKLHSIDFKINNNLWINSRQYFNT